MQAHDMPVDEFRRFGYEVVDWIAGYLDSTRDYPVFPRMEPGALVDALPAEAPETGEPMEQILADFRNLVVPAMNHWNHPRFHGYFSTSASAPGILGEMLAAAVNGNGMLWKSCPAAVELETVVLSWLRQWLGLPAEFFGMIHDTASSSTMHAIGAARAQADAGLRLNGASEPLVMYCSEHAHSSVEKGALSLGVGQANVRKIGVDSLYRMRVDLLEASIAADRAAGRKPFCVVSTLGTTSVTSVDPIPAVQAVAEREGLWHHVDAAYGGIAAMLPENRWMLEGTPLVDSMVVNPHKWLFAPMDISAFFCRRPEALKAAYSVVPPYLASVDNPRAVNLMDYRVQLGSRFRALKLWFIMRYFGHEQVCAVVRNHLRWAQELAEAVRADERFEVAAPVPMSLVCLRYKGTDEQNRRLLELLNASGVAFSSGNVLDGRFVLRIALGNLRTTRDDVFLVWNEIRRLSEQL